MVLLGLSRMSNADECRSLGTAGGPCFFFEKIAEVDAVKAIGKLVLILALLFLVLIAAYICQIHPGGIPVVDFTEIARLDITL